MATNAAVRQLQISSASREAEPLWRTCHDPYCGRSCDVAICVVQAMAIVISILGLYLMVGVLFAVAFIVSGVTQVQPAPVAVGARLLILLGAAALWPFLLRRWLKSRNAR